MSTTISDTRHQRICVACGNWFSAYLRQNYCGLCVTESAVVPPPGAGDAPTGQCATCGYPAHVPRHDCTLWDQLTATPPEDRKTPDAAWVYVVTHGGLGTVKGEFWTQKVYATYRLAERACQDCRASLGGQFRNASHLVCEHVVQAWESQDATVWLERLAVDSSGGTPSAGKAETEVDRIVCGDTYADPKLEARVEAARTIDIGEHEREGCGESMHWSFGFRCVECGRWFHRACIQKHFTSHSGSSTPTVPQPTEEDPTQS